MSYLKNADLESFEELDDADLATVIGGGLVGDLATGVAAANEGIGNGGTPTTGVINFISNTTIGAGTYLGGVGNGLEEGLQAINATVSGTAGQL
ncbi:ComC/BlpC family leader-containing pheromone/bacteriocin [Microcoleus sp. F6_B4]